MEISKIKHKKALKLLKPDIGEDVDISPFKNDEDGADYSVWRVTLDGEAFVLKKAKEREIEIYSAFLAGQVKGAPEFLGSVCVDGENYFLMSFIDGKDLRRCDTDSLKKALDALIELQKSYWNSDISAGISYEKSLEGRRDRGKYLNDDRLERAYGEFLSVYQELPRSLCHDDLLPFNVLVDDDSIAVIDVPIEEASRFGIMSAHDDGTIYKFSEKPKNPDSTKASMGIYIFTKDKLQKYLETDSKDPTSANDFGKNIIPAMLAAGEKMMAYPFEGYWKDVGTIRSLWEANMDLLGERPVLSLSDESWRIYSRHGAEAPQFIGEGATVVNSSVTAGCEIYGTVKNSVLGPNVTVEAGAVVEDSVIMNDVTVKAGATVRYAILDANVTIGKKAAVGKDSSTADEIAVIGANVSVPDGKVISAGAMVSEI